VSDDIVLPPDARAALLFLQSRSALMAQTAGRLTSGLKVASPTDDPVAYYQAQALSERATDFINRKSEIDQGVSCVQTALVGTEASVKILKQMKGLVASARTAAPSVRASLGAEFNDLSKQLNSVIGDTSYQGVKLLSGSTAGLTVYFSEGTAAALAVNAQNLNASAVLSAAGPASSGVLGAMLSGGGIATDNSGFSVLSDSSLAAAVFDDLSAQLDSSLSTVRATAARLGGNVTTLQTRLDFTTAYVGTLQDGAAKLTEADMNEEAADMVALQTSYQIGMAMLGIAGQNRRAILSLFR